MVVFPGCKINIGLNILNKRLDGYHHLQTIFYPIDIKDALEIIVVPNQPTAVVFRSSGIEIIGNSNQNLCVKAYHLLKKDFPELAPVEMHLHKTIPMGAGLGGGSADAAFALLLLNQLFELQLSTDSLMKYALQLGSDCPFFIYNKPCLATGRGEIIEPIQLDLSAYKILVVNPGIHINTTMAFKHITPGIHTTDLRKIIEHPISQWKNLLINDFEKTIFEQEPAIQYLKESLYQAGALYASMSGSGSSVFGIFDTQFNQQLNLPQECYYKWV
ncbi:MAG: 4-(cytidine 5'-diphospho)-2-C-methyl-D-erythritol kinase [Ferruginibacter sp.]